VDRTNSIVDYMDCISCQKPSENELIYETQYWKVILAPDQSYLGRCYVTLKRHCGDLAELKREEWLDLAEIVKKIENSLKKSFGAAMFNWTCLMNDAYQNIPPNPHIHWHLKPRYNHKIEFAGLTFEDVEFGHHYARGTNREFSEEITQKVIEKIKENL